MASLLQAVEILDSELGLESCLGIEPAEERGRCRTVDTMFVGVLALFSRGESEACLHFNFSALLN